MALGRRSGASTGATRLPFVPTADPAAPELPSPQSARLPAPIQHDPLGCCLRMVVKEGAEAAGAGEVPHQFPLRPLAGSWTASTSSSLALWLGEP